VRTPVILALVLVTLQPAQACHRFHVWRYPWRQQCSTQATRAALTLPVQTAVHVQTPEERVTVEITLTSELLENWARQDALDKLRDQLK